MGSLLFADGPASSEFCSKAALFLEEDILDAKTNQTPQQNKSTVQMMAYREVCVRSQL